MATERDKRDARELVARAQRADRQALEELLARHAPRLEALVRSRLSAPLDRRLEAADVLQETALRAQQAIAKFEWRDEESFFRWLAGIAAKVILEAAKDDRRHPAVPLDRDVQGDSLSQSRALRREERFERLDGALNLLSPEHRQVILLVRVEGLAISEVARRMDRTPHAVSNLLLRAARKLKEVFGDTESLGLPDRSLQRSEGERHDG